MEDKIKKANTWSGAINGWIKIVVVVAGLIGGGFLTYSEIKFNTAKNEMQDLMDKDIISNMKREFEVQHERSDKRYTRATQMYNDLHNHSQEQLDDIRELETDVAFIKGVMSVKDK